MGIQGRKVAAACVGIVALVLLGGCDRGVDIEEIDGDVSVLTVSETWQAGAGPDAAARIAALTEAIDRLRRETSSGWIGGQDDETGFLGQLRGGTYSGGRDARAIVTRFLDRHAGGLFGISGQEIALERQETTIGEAVTLRGIQVAGAVPVDTGQLVFTLRDRRLIAVNGRVYPGITAVDEPEIGARRAARIARRSSRGTVQGQPELIVLPDAEGGNLVWEVRVLGARDPLSGAESAVTLYLVDALTGDVVGRRPGSIEAVAHTGSAIAEAATFQQQAQEEAVQVSGRAPNGQDLTAVGTRTADGRIVLVDRTAPTYDATTGKGAIETHDATGLQKNMLPGPLAASPDQQIQDQDAIAAQSYSRSILDFYREAVGRNSWDGDGGSLISSVNFGPESFCNAYFDGRQAVYGNGCVRDGEQVTSAWIDSDFSAHEITHGVTRTTSGLIYSGQSGALNESFSDYFGSVIGNRIKGVEDARIGEDLCLGITAPTSQCKQNPDGSLSLRYMLNGATLTDYLYALDLPIPLEQQLDWDQDHGGVHWNSAIWNNAMWSIRDLLAKLDNQPANASARAQQFDQTAYLALTRLTPSAGFVDARLAVEQAATDAGMDSDSLRVIRETFDLNQICEGCIGPAGGGVPEPLAAPGVQQAPVVSGSHVAWVDAATADRRPSAFVQRGGGPATKRNTEGAFVVAVAWAGETLVWAEEGPEGIVVKADDGTNVRTVDPTLELQGGNAGLGSSQEGAAWWNGTTRELRFLDAGDGQVKSTPLPPQMADEPVISIATGGGTVAAGGKQGSVVFWRPGSGEATVLTNAGKPIFAIGVSGDAVVTVAEHPYRGRVTLHRNGAETTLSETGSAFGAAVTPDYAVWAQSITRIGGKVGELAQASLPDTDLYLHSFASGQTFALLTRRGQQGFPSISGNRIAWQDGSLGGDDIQVAELPSGL